MKQKLYLIFFRNDNLEIICRDLHVEPGVLASTANLITRVRYRSNTYPVYVRDLEVISMPGPKYCTFDYRYVKAGCCRMAYLKAAELREKVDELRQKKTMWELRTDMRGIEPERLINYTL